jgi:hypothetical protein
MEGTFLRDESRAPAVISSPSFNHTRHGGWACKWARNQVPDDVEDTREWLVKGALPEVKKEDVKSPSRTDFDRAV